MAIATLALAIGANTTVFSVVNGLLLRSMAVADPHRLVTVSNDFALGRGFRAGLGWNAPMWERMRERAGEFAAAFAWSSIRGNLAQGGEEVQPIDILEGSGELLPRLG